MQMFMTLLLRALIPTLSINKDNSAGVGKCFIYILIIIGLIWLSIGSYWFLSDECIKSRAAVVSSMIFFVIAMVKIVSCYMKKKIVQAISLDKIIEEASKYAAEGGKNVQNLIKNKSFQTAISTGLAIIIIYKIFSKKH